MNSRVAFPFLTLSDHAIGAGPWLLSLNNGEQRPVAEYLPDWDYASVISLQRAVTLNRELAAAELEINPGHLSLSLCVRVGTGAGRLPRSIVSRQQCSFDHGTDTVIVDVDIPGCDLSAVLNLMTEVVIEQAPVERGDLSPSKPFERVWHQTHRILIEGEEPRFPIEVADLGALLPAGIATSAPWYVHWSPGDWSGDFHGSMRLYLNEDHSTFIERVTEGDPETLRAIMADVMSQVCERLLGLDECEALADGFEEGSLGSQAVSWLKAAWPDRDLGFVQSQLRSRPGSFRATIHALAEQRGVE